MTTIFHILFAVLGASLKGLVFYFTRIDAAFTAAGRAAYPDFWVPLLGTSFVILGLIVRGKAPFTRHGPPAPGGRTWRFIAYTTMTCWLLEVIHSLWIDGQLRSFIAIPLLIAALIAVLARLASPPFKLPIQSHGGSAMWASASTLRKLRIIR